MPVFRTTLPGDFIQIYHVGLDNNLAKKTVKYLTKMLIKLPAPLEPALQRTQTKVHSAAQAGAPNEISMKEGTTMMRKMVMLLLILAVALSLAPQGVMAQSADTDPQGRYVRFEYTRTKTLYGLQWTDDKGILHVRHQTDIGLIQGGLKGYAVVIFNCDLDTKTGNGKEYGTITIYETTSAKARPVQWSGDWTHEVRGGTVVAGEMAAKRAGLNEGLWLYITKIYTSRSTSPVVLVHEGSIQSVP